MAGFLGNPRLIMMQQDQMPVANYQYPQNPTVDINPPHIPVSWLNTLTGELFICTDNMPGNNVWTTIGTNKVSTLVFEEDFSTDVISNGLIKVISGTWSYNSESGALEQTDTTSGQCYALYTGTGFPRDGRIEGEFELLNDPGNRMHFGFFLQVSPPVSLYGLRVVGLDGAPNIGFYQDTSSNSLDVNLKNNILISDFPLLVNTIYKFEIRYSSTLGMIKFLIDDTLTSTVSAAIGPVVCPGFHAYKSSIAIHNFRIYEGF